MRAGSADLESMYRGPSLAALEQNEVEIGVEVPYECGVVMADIIKPNVSN